MTESNLQALNYVTIARYLGCNRPVSYSQLPLITMTIDLFSQYEPRLDVKYSKISARSESPTIRRVDNLGRKVMGGGGDLLIWKEALYL